MEFRYLGNSGLKISEITYGNWLTHGSQVENDVATKCVRAALDAGISTFDTADVYANTKAESVLGEALKGERRESLEIFTKVYWPTGPGGPNDTGLSRKHIMPGTAIRSAPAAKGPRQKGRSLKLLRLGWKPDELNPTLASRFDGGEYERRIEQPPTSDTRALGRCMALQGIPGSLVR